MSAIAYWKKAINLTKAERNTNLWIQTYLETYLESSLVTLSFSKQQGLCLSQPWDFVWVYRPR